MTTGEILRHAREARQITLEGAADITKIRRKYLEALEQEQFHILPDQIYGRWFLQTYARFLGLDPRELVKELEHPLYSDTNNDTKQPLSRTTVKNTGMKTALSIRKIEFQSRLGAGRDALIMAQIRERMAGRKRQEIIY